MNAELAENLKNSLGLVLERYEGQISVSKATGTAAGYSVRIQAKEIVLSTEEWKKISFFLFPKMQVALFRSGANAVLSIQ